MFIALSVLGAISIINLTSIALLLFYNNIFFTYQHVMLDCFQLVQGRDIREPAEYPYISINNVSFNTTLFPVISLIL